MGKQHNNFSKDRDLLAEMYGSIGAQHTFQDFGNAQQAADHMREEEGEDKTGHLNDAELLKKVKGMGTAGDRLIDAAEERLKEDPDTGLTDHERDALARDAYGDAEKKIAHDHEDHSEDGEY
tara:strand:+ start:75 stop:440 length:366 start_codon:yes stop_codon:yes gene_type:complete